MKASVSGKAPHCPALSTGELRGDPGRPCPAGRVPEPPPLGVLHRRAQDRHAACVFRVCVPISLASGGLSLSTPSAWPTYRSPQAWASAPLSSRARQTDHARPHPSRAGSGEAGSKLVVQGRARANGRGGRGGPASLDTQDFPGLSWAGQTRDTRWWTWARLCLRVCGEGTDCCPHPESELEPLAGQSSRLQ